MINIPKHTIITVSFTIDPLIPTCSMGDAIYRCVCSYEAVWIVCGMLEFVVGFCH